MLTIRWIGQGGFILTDGVHEICIDPYLSDVVNRIAQRPRMVAPCIEPEALQSDVVVCTHNHLDHVDIDAIPRMNKEEKIFLAPEHAREQLLACGVRHYQRFDEGDCFTLGDFSLEAVYAAHTVPAIGVMVRHNGVTLYFSGDTLYDARLTALADKHIDVMFICINGKLGNMNVDEAVTLTHEVSPRVGVPIHYGMFESNTEDPTKYTSRVPHGFEMTYGRTYTIDEVLQHV